MHRDDHIARESLVDRCSSSNGLIISPLKSYNAGSTGALCAENPVHLSALGDISPQFQKHNTCRGISIKNKFLWPQNEDITYSYISGSHLQHSKVDSGITLWSQYINLTFRRVSSGGSVRISFNDDEGSWSYLGALCLRAHIDTPTMNLQGIDDVSEILQDREKATVLHEFGHAIGLLHEHQSPSRIGEFTLNEKGIIKYYETSHEWSRAEIQCQVIDIYKEKYITNFSQFDQKSVMMYPMYPSHTLEGLELPLNTELSDIDKAFAMVHYPRLEPQLHPPQWTVAHALDILCVRGTFRNQILQSNSPREISHLFSLWNAERLMKQKSSDQKSYAGHQKDEDVTPVCPGAQMRSLCIWPCVCFHDHMNPDHDLLMYGFGVFLVIVTYIVFLAMDV